jgi:hypothetical protein
MNVDEFLNKGKCTTPSKTITSRELTGFHNDLFKAFQQESHCTGTRRMKVLSKRTDCFLT